MCKICKLNISQKPGKAYEVQATAKQYQVKFFSCCLSLQLKQPG